MDIHEQCSFKAKTRLMIWVWILAYACVATLANKPLCVVCDAQSILPHAGNKANLCYKAEIEKGEKVSKQSPGVESRTPGLCSQCSAIKPQQTNNHQPTKSSICTTESLSHTHGSYSACAVRTPLGVGWKFSPSGENLCWVVFEMPRASCLMLEMRCYFPDVENFLINP